MAELTELEPKSVWTLFKEITRIPRPSEHEEKMREWIIQWAKNHGLTYKQDDYGNVVVYVPPTPNMEDAPIIIVQGHLDMVCEKNADVTINFLEQGIEAYVDGDFVRAKGTTLGADNGIGVAMALALVEDNVAHGPLELLFTVEEETGLFGANNLGDDMIHGMYYLNVDSEEQGVITVGSAGGGDTVIMISPNWEQAIPNATEFEINITGLKGGHSGVDIDKIRANAIKLLGQILYEIIRETPVYLTSVDAGNRRNAIPRYGKARFLVTNENKVLVENAFNTALHAIKKEWSRPEPELTITLTSTPPSSKQALSSMQSQTIIELINAAPHGVIRYSPVLPDLVETSTNFAKAIIQDNQVYFEYSTRSSVQEALEAQRKRIEAYFKLVNASIEHDEAYPGWEPDTDNEWFKLVKESYATVIKEEPQVISIHAGLETGAIKGKYPNMQLVAIGPTIIDAHSPTERVNIHSVQILYDVIKQIITSAKQLPKP